MTVTRLDLLVVLLPTLLLVLVVTWARRRQFVAHPLVFQLRERIPPAPRILHLPRWLEWGALGCLAVALLNPVLPTAEHFAVSEGLDLFLALDLSSSMQEPIDPPGALARERQGYTGPEKTRLDAVKEAMLRFVGRRRGDRIGLVVFSEDGYVVTPLTSDLTYVTRYLQMVDSKTLASEGQTAIGEGILTALQLGAKQISPEANGRRGKAIVVLTDGENNSGRDVHMAIRKAFEGGYRVHFVGIQVEKAKDGPRLIASVEAAGGRYFDVRDERQLGDAYAEIDRMEKRTYLTKTHVVNEPFFSPFVLTVFLLLAASVVLRGIPHFIEIT